MKLEVSKSVVKAIMLSVLIIFSIEFTLQRIMLEFLKEHSYQEMNKCLLGDDYTYRNLIENKTWSFKNIEKDEREIYDKLIDEIEKKEKVNECLIDYIYERNNTAQKNISSYLYTILTLIIILTFSSLISFFKRRLKRD